eukprot:TRINITY_DN27895_c0_g2_i1.p1 TRINITY_DN27895_c0_g2~~TRINITY_DN27895_c0_g2_i1.p1  ORF type:complete len:412 (-),score=67.92 TRINITY_DN27895_c0_g2_i1:209-1354(-)
MSVQDVAVRGLWGHICARIPLPDDNPVESYRPPIDKMLEEFFWSVAVTRHRLMEDVKSGGTGRGVWSAGEGRAAWSAGSTGASLYSEGSSTGSTPTGFRGRRNNTAGSPMSACSSYGSAGGPQPYWHAQEPKPVVATGGRFVPLSSVTVTPGSSPHSMASSCGLSLVAGHPAAGYAQAGMVARGVGPLAHQACGPLPHNRGAIGSSRGSSPWHLPSPASEMSTASDRMNSSQPSGSDSCGEVLGTSQLNVERCGSEDHSHSDTQYGWQRHSDSDWSTPRSNEAAGHSARGSSGAEEAQRWACLRLPRRLDSALSPGSTGATGNFREAVGMTETGPVVPFGPGAAGAGAPAFGQFSPLPRVGHHGRNKPRTRGRRHTGSGNF